MENGKVFPHSGTKKQAYKDHEHTPLRTQTQRRGLEYSFIEVAPNQPEALPMVLVLRISMWNTPNSPGRSTGNSITPNPMFQLTEWPLADPLL